MYKVIKRIFDIFFAVVLLILGTIPMLFVAIAIKIEDGGPIIYKSKRMGKDLKPFYTYKFRSMKVNRKELNSNMTHDQMVTRVGKFIRKTSLDELPQIFNVLKGEMSFVGPRPWITDYYEWFNDEQKRRASVAPGITGLAQAKGRNGISVLKKIDYDLEYVDNISLWMDIKCIFLTIRAVLREENAEITENGIKSELQSLERTSVAYEKIKQIRDMLGSKQM